MRAADPVVERRWKRRAQRECGMRAPRWETKRRQSRSVFLGERVQLARCDSIACRARSLQRVVSKGPTILSTL